MRRILTMAAATITAFSALSCSADSTRTVHPNEEMLRRGYEAFNRKDMPTVMGLFADDVTFIVPGRSIQAGTFSGKSEVQRYFSLVGKHTAGTHKVQLVEALADDDRAMLLVRALGQHGDKTFDMPLVHAWRIREGKLTQLHIIPTDQYAFDQFWS